ncbi:MAG TPA: P-II family nitrogen regulator [Clostridiaceae bacterium]|nr:P-II family nitrogen regulator [Clostridiaceae bacterium]
MGKNEQMAKTDNHNKKIREMYSLLIMISTPKKVEEMANYALANGADGAFFSYARGTIPNSILSLLGLAGIKREIAVLSVPKSIASPLLGDLNQRFNLAEKLGGIAYLVSLEQTKAPIDNDLERTHSVIATIVNEGEGEDVVEYVRRRFHVGATILYASGSADHSKKIFNFEIVPKKEIVLMVSKKNFCEAIFRTIHDSLRTELPGRGIIFATDLDEVAGIFEKDRRSDKTFIETENVQSTGSIIHNAESETLPSADSNKLSKTGIRDVPHQIAVLVLVDRGHTGAIIRLAEAVGSRGATIMRGRFKEQESRGFLSHTGDIGKEAIIMIASKETALDILRQIHQYTATHPELHILLTWMRIHSFSRFSYGVE